jgi:hypothetical protein
LKVVRRELANWDAASTADRKQAKKYLDNKFKQKYQYIDINLAFSSTQIK